MLGTRANFALQSNGMVVPAGKEFTAAMPDGSKGLRYTSRYNVVGAAEDAAFSAHILNQFDIPKGSVINASVGGAQPETTEWTSVNDLKKPEVVVPHLPGSVDPHGRS